MTAGAYCGMSMKAKRSAGTNTYLDEHADYLYYYDAIADADGVEQGIHGEMGQAGVADDGLSAAIRDEREIYVGDFELRVENAETLVNCQ